MFWEFEECPWLVYLFPLIDFIFSIDSFCLKCNIGSQNVVVQGLKINGNNISLFINLFVFLSFVLK